MLDQLPLADGVVQSVEGGGTLCKRKGKPEGRAVPRVTLRGHCCATQLDLWGLCLWERLCSRVLFVGKGFLLEIMLEWHCHALQRGEKVLGWPRSKVRCYEKRKQTFWPTQLFQRLIGRNTFTEKEILSRDRARGWASSAACLVGGQSRGPLCLWGGFQEGCWQALGISGWQTAWCFRLWFLPLKGPCSCSVYIRLRICWGLKKQRGLSLPPESAFVFWLTSFSSIANALFADGTRDSWTQSYVEVVRDSQNRPVQYHCPHREHRIWGHLIMWSISRQRLHVRK